jgi:hypothetical protein
MRNAQMMHGFNYNLTLNLVYNWKFTYIYIAYILLIWIIFYETIFNRNIFSRNSVYWPKRWKQVCLDCIDT